MMISIHGNCCCNIQFAFCDELKAYFTGFVRSGNTYTANGASEMMKEITANMIKDAQNIMFRMDSGCFGEEMIETLGCKYLIKAKMTNIVSVRCDYVCV